MAARRRSVRGAAGGGEAGDGVITVLLVDDRAGVRRGLRMRLDLEPDLAVVGEAPDGATAVARAAALRPDVVVMDVAMPDLDGVAATAMVRATAPECAVVILSLHGDAATRARAMAAGAAAFVEKQAAEPALLDAIRRAAAGPPASDAARGEER
jgi:DNA-binding NarL/FixJ family response regulator